VGDQSFTLVRVDPRTLLPLRRSALRVGSVGSWSFLPDRSRLAVVTFGPPGRCPRSALRFFDATTMRPSGRLAIRRGGGVEALSWLRADRLLAVRTACEGHTSSFVVIDPIAGRVLKSEPIEGDLVRLVPAATKVVALVASRHAIGPSRLLVVDAEGVVRGRVLDKIPAGAQAGPSDVVRYARPALAAGGERAFVVSTGGLVAEVELETLAVTYHPLVQRTVSARAKGSEGWSRRALCLGNGVIAVSGRDEELFTGPTGRTDLRDVPAGVELFDTRSWKVRVVDERGDSFNHADRLLYVTRYSWDSSTQKVTAMGVAAYGVDGVQRFHLVPQALVYRLLVYRGQAYVGLNPTGGPYLVVDIPSGRVVGRRTSPLPRLLREQASPFWGNGY
jgi:hypothetical protein